jgi:hypothetical protein
MRTLCGTILAAAIAAAIAANAAGPVPKWKLVGTPKTLGFFAIFGFDRATRQLRRSSEGAGASAAAF